MKKNKLTNQEIANFTSSMALILHSGISPYEGVLILSEDNEDNKMKNILSIISEHLSYGESFYDSLTACEVFPDYLLNMVQIGELSGKLEEVMQSLSIHYQRRHDNSEMIKSALTYPFIMIIMMFVVMIVLMTQVLPIFNQVFEQLGASMTGFSKIVLDLGIFMSHYAYVFLAIFILIIIAIIYLIKNNQGKKSLYHFLTRWRLTRKTALQLALSQFTSGMSIALSSGLDVEQSLDMAKTLITHPELSQRLKEVKASLTDQDLSTALVDKKIITGMHAKLLKLGNKTGHIDTIMKDIADQYDQETNERILHLISIIEPTLVAILSIFVGLILLSVMLPLIGIMSSL